MNTLKKVLVILLCLCILVGAIAFDAFYSAPSRFVVRYETISSIYIPEDLNDMSVLFFSDLEYGEFMDENRLSKLIESINDLSPDIVIFGGDLFADEYTPNNTDVETVSNAFKQIEASLGKFAVLGDNDQETLDDMSTSKSLLYDADFEVLDNTSITVRDHGSASITLVGLQNGVNGYVDTDTAFENVPRTAFTFVICHTPDTASVVPTDLTKYFLAGHSHGGQAYYGFGALYTPTYAENYFRGTHTINSSFTLDITSGVGTVNEDVRFLANAEIVMYRLEHQSIYAD